MIELHALRQRYGEESPLALNIEALTLPAGEVVGLLGENGAGKSTLLRILAGIDTPWGGQVLLDGTPPAARLADIAFASEEGTVPSFLNAREYGAFLADFWPSFDPAYYASLLEFFRLPADRPAGRLSRGQRSKLEVTAAAARRPKFLLLDEPFLGEDVFARQDFLKLLLSSLDETMTVLLSTHQLAEIETCIDRAVILKQGAVADNVELETLRAAGETLIERRARLPGYDPERYKQYQYVEGT